jgi:hypothetical protein
MVWPEGCENLRGYVNIDMLSQRSVDIAGVFRNATQEVGNNGRIAG